MNKKNNSTLKIIIIGIVAALLLGCAVTAIVLLAMRGSTLTDNDRNRVEEQLVFNNAATPKPTDIEPPKDSTPTPTAVLIAHDPEKISQHAFDAGDVEEQISSPENENPEGDNPYITPMASIDEMKNRAFTHTCLEDCNRVAKEQMVNVALLKMFAIDRSFYGQLDTYLIANNPYRIPDESGESNEVLYVHYMNFWDKEVAEEGYYVSYDSTYDAVTDFAMLIKRMSYDAMDIRASLKALAETGYINSDEIERYASKATVYEERHEYTDEELEEMYAHLFE